MSTLSEAMSSPHPNPSASRTDDLYENQNLPIPNVDRSETMPSKKSCENRQTETEYEIAYAKDKDPVSPLQFKIFRLVFGAYLIWHFYSLINFGPELFSNEGMIPYPNMNPTWSIWAQYIPSAFIPLTAAGISGFLNIMIVSALFFALGMSQFLNSIILWYGWAFLFNRNNFIANPGLPYVGWLLLACAIIPNPGPLKLWPESIFGSPNEWPYFSLQQLKHLNDLRAWTFSKIVKTPSCDYQKQHNQKKLKNRNKKQQKDNYDDDIDDKKIGDRVLSERFESSERRFGEGPNVLSDKSNNTDYGLLRNEREKNENFSRCQNNSDNVAWRMPPLIFWGAWFLMALGYTISGIHKLQCASWIDGSALLHVLESLLARDNNLVNFMIELMKNYPWFLKLNTWASLVLEISFLPLGIFDRLRFVYWISFIVMHIGIMCLIDFTDLTLGVLMIHLFTFDKRWIQ